MRINKFLAENGVASRRAADKMIEDGDVEINGRIARLGDNVEPDDVVRANGKIVGHNTKIEYYLS